MKKIFSKIILLLFMFSITLSNIGNVHANEAISKSRIFGNDRVETSIKISENGWQNGTDTAIIAQGYGYADALCAAPLAKKYNAPLLLTDKSGLNNGTINELKRLKVKNVFLIGGSGALSSNVENQLKNLGINHIERLWGKDRYETSLKIAESLGEVNGVVVTSGNGYADSLSIAPIAAQKGMPILLSDKNGLTDGIKNYIKDKNIKNTYIVGGTGVIDTKIQNDLSNAKRLSGQDRFETNLAVMNEFQNELKFEKIFIAEGNGVSGNEFADALSGAVLAAQSSSPLVLIYKTMPTKTAEFIKAKMSNKTQLIALGGDAVVANSVLNGLIDLFSGKTVPTTSTQTTTSSGGSSSGGSSGGSSGNKTFTMTITKNNGATTIKTFTITIDKDKANENSMEYLKSVAKVTELQGPGFINGIDGLLNVFLKDLPISDRKAGYYGIDWFIYLNGKLTPVGATGVYPKEGDTLNFDYHEWDWHALVAPGTTTMPLNLESVPSSIKSGQSIKLRATCVYRGVYNVAVKVDGKQVAATDIDGYATIAINGAGTHTVTLEKDGASKSKTVTVTSSGHDDPDINDLELNTLGENYDGNASGNKSEISGNVIISANNVSLKNVNVDEELIIDPGADGNSNITNVTASKIVVKSGGVNSIHFSNVKSDFIEINSSSNVRIEGKDETQIKNTQVSNSCVLDTVDSKSYFGQVTAENNDKNDCGTLELRGNFADNIEVKSNVKIVASSTAPIPEVKVNSDSKPNVVLQGKFGNINVAKEAVIEANSSEISKIDTDADVTIKLNDDKSTVGSIKKAKDVKIECKDKDNKDIKTIPIEEKQSVSVSGITLDKTEAGLAEGETLQLTASVQPDNATNRNVTWSSNDVSVASVDASGKVTAVKEGIATITATTVDGNKTASCIMTVTKQNPSKDTFTLLVTRDNGTTTLKKQTMTIDKDKKNENAMEYLKSIAAVTELQGPGFINGIDGLLNVFLKDMPIEERKAGYYGIDWFIYLNGNLTPVGATGVHPKAGDTLKFDYHKWDWHALVSPGTTVMPLTLENIPASIKSGDSIKLKVTCVFRGVYDASVKVDGKQVTTTDIDGYATIIVNGSGTHTITVEKNGGSKTRTVNVTDKDVPIELIPVTGISLNKANVSLKVGEALQLNATIQPNNATNKNVAWISSDAAVATVDGSGKITSLKEGTTTITVTTADGNKEAFCIVTVTKGEVPTTDTNLINILGDVSLNIIETKEGNIKLQGNSKNDSDIIAITLYDEQGNLKYINQTTGSMNVITKLASGKYHGYIKSSSTSIVNIGEFEVK
ncbi:cell wall-binding repeat-containing protein [Clostridium scatologenes]|uniref:Ig domain protein group 2 domain protein n=1 Tax=Clostridium scatologenes TaxID=1548 RepID=A0A0E3M6H3_CLOSL|nr:cell wall-binding repeat-containing protein [Clostridium scatologenes]AKA67672.1 Ig domain protein group 2 domain protein [Clostridium scatologenes]